VSAPAAKHVGDGSAPWGEAASSKAPKVRGMGLPSLPVIDHVWRVRGEVPIDPPLAPEEALARIAPLLDTPGSTYAITGPRLHYVKRNPAAQDRLATFTRGRFEVATCGARQVLRFDVFSHALLLCFLAPLLFLAFAQAAIVINEWEKATEAAEASGKPEDKPKVVRKLHPIDAFLGAPAPEDPARKKKDKDEGPHSPKRGYFFAGLFLAVYVVGRWLEPWLLRRRLRAALAAAPIPRSG
jgi:hypothetical protein